ncbi:hypothetical protein LJC48_07465 [Desulfovibrio sp. OttesenSCG-928-C06]|nr:hypothetical protein [Desulfovibrio sp. OttesenSCG-928-C06]
MRKMANFTQDHAGIIYPFQAASLNISECLPQKNKKLFSELLGTIFCFAEEKSAATIPDIINALSCRDIDKESDGSNED